MVLFCVSCRLEPCPWTSTSTVPTWSTRILTFLQSILMRAPPCSKTGATSRWVHHWTGESSFIPPLGPQLISVLLLLRRWLRAPRRWRFAPSGRCRGSAWCWWAGGATTGPPSPRPCWPTSWGWPGGPRTGKRWGETVQIYFFRA